MISLTAIWAHRRMHGAPFLVVVQSTRNLVKSNPLFWNRDVFKSDHSSDINPHPTMWNSWGAATSYYDVCPEERQRRDKRATSIGPKASPAGRADTGNQRAAPGARSHP